jgi:Repeat of unknown function (DUF5907)
MSVITTDALLIIVRKLEARIASMVSNMAARSGMTQLTGAVTAGPGNGSQVATITNNAVTNTKLADMAQATIKGRAAAAGTGDPQDLTANQTSTILDTATDPFLRTSAAGSPGITQLTGDVTAGPGTGSQAATIANDAVTFAKMQNVAASKLVGRGSAGGTGDPEEITLGTGLSMSGTTLNGTAAVSDGDKGDITVSGSGATWTIDNDVVTPAKMDDGGACSVLGRSANSSGDRADISAGSNNRFLARKSNALSWEQIDLASGDVTGDLPIGNLAARRCSASFQFDNNGAEIADNTKARWRVPNGVTATLVRWTILADVSGSITLDIYKAALGSYPPTSGVTGTGTKPNLSSTDHGDSTTFTNYTTTTFSGGDTVIINVDSCTTITACDLELEFDVIQ